MAVPIRHPTPVAVVHDQDGHGHPRDLGHVHVHDHAAIPAQGRAARPAPRRSRALAHASGARLARIGAALAVLWLAVAWALWAG